MTEQVLYEIRGAVAVLSFNRPDRNNAWTPQMDVEYSVALDRAVDDESVRAIVVTGVGRAFCPGADLAVLSELGSSGGPSFGSSTRPAALGAMIPKPLIAAINGACAGVGLSQALMADLRFAAAGAKLTTSFSQRGLVAEYATAWLLPRIVGRSRALDLLLSSRVVRAEEALELGLVDYVVPADEVLDRAVAYAQDLADNCSPASMAMIKRQLAFDADLPLEAAGDRALRLMLHSFAGPDFVEGVASFQEKRQAAFPPLGKGTVFG